MLSQKSLKFERVFIETVVIVVIRVVKRHRVIAQVHKSYLSAGFFRSFDRRSQNSATVRVLSQTACEGKDSRFSRHEVLIPLIWKGDVGSPG